MTAYGLHQATSFQVFGPYSEAIHGPPRELLEELHQRLHILRGAEERLLVAWVPWPVTAWMFNVRQATAKQLGKLVFIRTATVIT